MVFKRMTLVRGGAVVMLTCGLSACGEDYIYDADAEVSLYIQSNAALGETVMLASGSTVNIQKAYLSLSASEIFACDESSLARQVVSFFVGEAVAHTTSTPTRNGVPYWLDLLSEDQLLSSVWYPPVQAEYCSLSLDFNRADNDTEWLGENIAGEAVADLNGMSLFIEGTYIAAGADTAIDFSLISQKNLLPVNIDYRLNLKIQPVAGVNLEFDLIQWLSVTEEMWGGDNLIDASVGEANLDSALVSLPDFWRVSAQ